MPCGELSLPQDLDKGLQRITASPSTGLCWSPDLGGKTYIAID